MEYLLDREQSETATKLLGEGLTQDILEEEIENLRAAFYRLQFSQDAGDVDIDALCRRAYLLATLVVHANSTYEPQVVGKALSVAAVIFEYVSQLGADIQERLNYALNAMLFYSVGEQEAQSATVARKILRSDLPSEFAFDADTVESWHRLLQFLGREFKAFLRWGRDSSRDFFSHLVYSIEDGPFWAALLQACLDVAKYMVWGAQLSHEEYFDNAISQARAWGNTRLTWLGLTVKEVAENMVARSLRARLSEMGMPGWVSEALTMDAFVEMWLPHRRAFQHDADLARGILSDNTKIALINMPTSAGKSLVAEIAILFELTRDSASKAIWVVPTRALVFEVQTRLSRHFRRVGISVSSLPGGLEADRDDVEALSSTRVFVLTPEKLDGLLRRNPALLDTVHIVVVDEMQKIGEIGRGWLFETVIAWLLLYAEQNENLRLVFMSAVLPNRPDFEVWLREQRHGFVSRWVTWHPTRLALFVTCGIYYQPWETLLIQRHTQETIAVHSDIRHPATFDVPLFLLRTLRSQTVEPQSILVFFYTKDDVNNFVSRAVQETEQPDSQPPLLAALSDKFATVYGHDHHFTRAIQRGIGVDHGDIPLWLRHLVEGAFREGQLPTLVANQAILEGVNFPIEDIIIGSLGSGISRNFRFRLRALDYTNLVGRVGRAMVDTEGRCFLVWNWFYDGKTNDNLSWDVYSAPTPRIEDIRSSLAINETELVNALQRLVSSLEGIDESAFDELGVWRDRLERLHSSALALLEQPGTVDYSRLSRWIQKTLAWQQLGSRGREALGNYVQSEWRGFESADRLLYRLASVSGLSVRSADQIRKIAREIIDDWSEDSKPTFETVFTPERFNAIVNVRECWGRRPVTYSTGGWVPRVDHFAATAAWIAGESWTEVATIICANHENLQEKTRSGIVAAYVSQMFEFRLPWVLGGVAIAVRELGGSEELCEFLEVLPSYVRYGVNIDEAVTISKLCRAERTTALALAQKFAEQQTEQIELKTWLQHCSLDNLREWLSSEPEILLQDLLTRLHSVRDRDWTLRREGQVVVELAGWRHYDWTEVADVLQSDVPVQLTLRREPDNPFDRFATAVDAIWGNKKRLIGYVPAIYAEDVAELLEWGRSINVRIHTPPLRIPPQILLHLLEVD